MANQVTKPKAKAAPVPVYFDAKWDDASAAALQALQRGDASPDQQRRALDWIINSASRYYDVSFIPDNQSATSFMEGRRFVGGKIVTLLKLNLQSIRKVTNANS